MNNKLQQYVIRLLDGGVSGNTSESTSSPKLPVLKKVLNRQNIVQKVTNKVQNSVSKLTERIQNFNGTSALNPDYLQLEEDIDNSLIELDRILLERVDKCSTDNIRTLYEEIELLQSNLNAKLRLNKLKDNGTEEDSNSNEQLK